jgi:hypothetical protein
LGCCPLAWADDQQIHGQALSRKNGVDRRMLLIFEAYQKFFLESAKFLGWQVTMMPRRGLSVSSGSGNLDFAHRRYILNG